MEELRTELAKNIPSFYQQTERRNNKIMKRGRECQPNKIYFDFRDLYMVEGPTSHIKTLSTVVEGPTSHSEATGRKSEGYKRKRITTDTNKSEEEGASNNNKKKRNERKESKMSPQPESESDKSGFSGDAY